MEGIIKLAKPILIDGRDITELKYDTDAITPELFSEAEGIKNKATKQITKGSYAGAMELDYSFHLYLGVAAIVAVNPGYEFEDVLRIKGHDIRKVIGIGRSFMTESDDSQEDSLEEPSETIQEYSMTPQENLEKEESEDF